MTNAATNEASRNCCGSGELCSPCVGSHEGRDMAIVSFFRDDMIKGSPAAIELLGEFEFCSCNNNPKH